MNRKQRRELWGKTKKSAMITQGGDLYLVGKKVAQVDMFAASTKFYKSMKAKHFAQKVYFDALKFLPQEKKKEEQNEG